MKHFITLDEISPADIRRLLAASVALKKRRSRRGGAGDVLKGATVALLFEKPSLRTRVSFEVAITKLGGHPVYLGPTEVGLGKRESVADVARNLGRWVDAIVARTFRHETVQELAQESGVPVINALTDREHPCQALGDLMTILERFGPLKGRAVAFVGDGQNNVSHALILGASKCGMHMRVACPKGYEPAAAVLESAKTAAASSGGSIRIVNDPKTAVSGADAVYTDVWISMGFESESESRRKAFAGFQVNSALMALAKKDAIFLHCLPARRGEEVTDDVLDGPQSAVLDQAENRMHTAKAVLAALMAPKVFAKI
ncbi:ornithine carbamoyltransferase [bacterium]|nr:ornithine carbamoyltransferase [bacterium]